MGGWTWVDAKVDGKPYVGAMPPITALAVGVSVCVVGYVERFFLFYFILQYRHLYI